jgi:hypothetical protein
MKKATSLLVSGLALAAFSGSASAITNDGTLDGSYGAPVAVQATQTQFGNSNLGVVDFANGSELDNAYAVIQGGVLHLFIGGNLESNFNKLELYFDTGAGGQNQLRSDNVDVDFNGLNRQAGLKFDVAFTADYYITVTGGWDGSSYRLFASYATLPTGGAGTGGYLGSNLAATPGPLGGGSNPDGIEITINNSNAAGVSDGCGASSGAGVATGIELAIPLAALGGSQCMNITAFVNGSGHDFVSNQVLGSYSGCNLGDPSFVDFSQQPGLQYFTVCDQSTSSRPSSWGGIKTLYR